MADTAVDMAITALGLRKQFGQFTAVDGIDFDIARGECFGFLGPNGAGKTSTMRMIYGRSPLTAGSLTVLGLDVTRHIRTIKGRLGVVPQEDNLDPDFSVLENLLVYSRYFRLPAAEARKRADDLLEWVQLQEKRDTNVEKLSGGMKRRLVIARSLINNPELVILDEPTTGLDPQARHLVWAKLRELKARGVTLILTTHYMEEAAQLCDRLAIMDRGRFLAEGNPGDLIKRHVAPIALELRVEPDQQPAVLAALPGIDHDAASDHLVLYMADNRAAEAALEALRRAGVSLPGYFQRPATLEDVFLRLAGRALQED